MTVSRVYRLATYVQEPRTALLPPLPRFCPAPSKIVLVLSVLRGKRDKKRPNAGKAFGKSWKNSVERRAKTTERGEPFDRTRSGRPVYLSTANSLTYGKPIEPRYASFNTQHSADFHLYFVLIRSFYHEMTPHDNATGEVQPMRLCV